MINAILLAAGQSKRLKSENKLIKSYKKIPLINHSLKVLQKSKVNKIIIVQTDMPFIKVSDINKIYNSIKLKKYLVCVLKFKNRIGNPIGFDISIMKKFKNIKGKFGAKFMVKRLKNRTRFIKISSAKSFKDFDKVSDFRV